MVRARLRLADGDHQEAERWARSAVELCSRTDYILEQATTKLELARVLTAAGNPDEAVAEAHEALELFQAKGDQPNTAKARILLDQLENG
jgi:HEPN domain-containing protein